MKSLRNIAFCLLSVALVGLLSPANAGGKKTNDAFTVGVVNRDTPEQAQYREIKKWEKFFKDYPNVDAQGHRFNAQGFDPWGQYWGPDYPACQGMEKIDAQRCMVREQTAREEEAKRQAEIRRQRESEQRQEQMQNQIQQLLQQVEELRKETARSSSSRIIYSPGNTNYSQPSYQPIYRAPQNESIYHEHDGEQHSRDHGDRINK